MHLTIGIPTYNRAEELDLQLQWLYDETVGHGDDVEIIVSDNCSSDHTPEIVAAWSQRFGPVRFRSQRHDENRGWMRNFLSIYEAAEGTFCWVIGDDDPVDHGALAKVLEVIVEDPELAIMYLNFYGRAADTGQVIGAHWFSPELADLPPTDGREIYQRAIEGHFGSVIFVSSAIVRTDLAIEGIHLWPECLDNWGGMAFWCAYAALQGHVYVTRETFVECTLGQSYWQKDPLAWFRIRHRDIPQVYRHMEAIGYRRGFCTRKIAKTAQEDVASKEAMRNLKEYLQAFRSRPLWAVGVLGSYLGCLAAVVLSL